MSTTRGELGGARSGWGLRPETVAPSCFASVMATGIVSIGAHLKGLTLAAATLYWLAVALYIFFIVLTAWRAVSHRAALRADLHNLKKAFGFFTFIAATNVLATALEGQSHLGAASALLGIGLLFWLVLGYGIPFTAILGADSRPVSASVNGTWFVWVVAAQSVVVAASGLASAMPGAAATSGVEAALAIIAVMTWAVGIGLYVACVVFLGVRTIVHRIGPADLDAPFWVTMGALAISVVAGSRIMEIDSSPMPTATRLLIGGTSVLLWSFATWLIPALMLAGAWRHLRHRVPLGYSAGLWSMVFPLGMYSVASIYLGAADDIPAIGRIGSWWYWIGFAAWIVVFCAMVAAFVRSLRRRSDSEEHNTPRIA